MPKGYSKPILLGLRLSGMKDAETQRVLGVAASFLSAIEQGKREFTDRQCRLIEDATDLTIGQLGALFLEPNGGPLTELSKGWAGVRHSLKRPRVSSKSSKRPASRRSARNAPNVTSIRAAG